MNNKLIKLKQILKAYDNEAIKDPELNKKRFINACKNKNYNRILELIDKVPSLATLTKDQTNPITILGLPIFQTYYKYKTVISELVKKEYVINYKNFRHDTILHDACYQRYNFNAILQERYKVILLNFVKFLIDCKINVNETNNSNETALYISCRNYGEYDNIISLLIDNK